MATAEVVATTTFPEKVPIEEVKAEQVVAVAAVEEAVAPAVASATEESKEIVLDVPIEETTAFESSIRTEVETKEVVAQEEVMVVAATEEHVVEKTEEETKTLTPLPASTEVVETVPDCGESPAVAVEESVTKEEEEETVEAKVIEKKAVEKPEE